MKELCIDVSTWNGTQIDYEAVRKSGIDYVIIRAGFGKYTNQKDNCFEVNYKNAKKAGLKVGAYWYAYATNKEDAIKEANACMECIKGKQFELPIYYDVEEDSILGLSGKQIGDIITGFCSTLEQNKYFVGLYCGFTLTNKVDRAIVNKYAVWFAQWYSVCQYTGEYGMWQFTDKLSVNGINGVVDGDYLYKDYTTIIKNGGFNGFTKATQTSQTVKKDVSYLQLAFETINGKYGSGSEREKLLGDKYDDVQDIVNILLSNADIFLKAKELYKRGLLK